MLEQCGGFGGTGLELAEAARLSHHSRDPALSIQRHHRLSWPRGVCRVCWRVILSPIAFGEQLCPEQSVRDIFAQG